MKLVAALLALLSLPAAAADLSLNKAPPKAYVSTYSWSGIYLYGFAGYGVDITTSTATMPGIGTLDVGGISAGPEIGGGLKLLYQLPTSSWVVGVSGDIAYANMKATGAATAINGFQALSLSNATNYLGCFCAELGYALGSDQRMLAYVTGGLGFGGAKPNLQVMGLQAAANDTSVGYAIGGGLSYALTDNVSLFTETRYYHLGNKSLSLGTLVTSSTPFDFLTQTAGLGVKF